MMYSGFSSNMLSYVLKLGCGQWWNTMLPDLVLVTSSSPSLLLLLSFLSWRNPFMGCLAYHYVLHQEVRSLDFLAM